jgi:ABC-type arginine/histidine transport system permease subunit
MFICIQLLFIIFLISILIKLLLGLMVILVNNADDIYIYIIRDIPFILKLFLIVGIYKVLIQN